MLVATARTSRTKTMERWWGDRAELSYIHRPAEMARRRCSATSWQCISGRTVTCFSVVDAETADGCDDGRSRPSRLVTSSAAAAAAAEWQDVQLEDFSDFTDVHDKHTLPSDRQSLLEHSSWFRHLCSISLCLPANFSHTCLNGHSRLTVTDTYLQCLHRTVGQSFSSF